MIELTLVTEEADPVAGFFPVNVATSGTIQIIQNLFEFNFWGR